MAFDKKKASTTKYIKVYGKVSYAKLYEPDDFRGEKKWKLNLYPNPASYDLMKKVGLQNKFKDDDGSKSGVTGRFCSLSRPVEKTFNGETQKFLPPEIRAKDGSKLVSYEFDDAGDVVMHGDKIIIGNGSEIEVDLAVYQTARFGAGSRFNSVRILDLIEYNPPEDVSENEVDEIEEKAKGKVAGLDDEIPFDEVPLEKPQQATKPKVKKVAW
jgi:hypothetical protein